MQLHVDARAANTRGCEVQIADICQIVEGIKGACIRLDAADEVREGGILDEAHKLPSVRCGHQLHAALRYAPGRQRLCLRPNLILCNFANLQSSLTYLVL